MVPSRLLGLAVTCAVLDIGVARWIKGPAAAVEEPHRVRLALKQKKEGVAWVRRQVLDVSDPASPRYGQHVTLKEIREHISPGPEVIGVVSRWAAELAAMHPPVCSAHVPSLAGSGDYLHIQTTVGCAAAIFGVKFYVYFGDRSNITRASPGSSNWRHTAPISVSAAIEAVHGLDEMPPTSAARLIQDDGPFPGDDITPPVIWKQYGIPTPSAAAVTKSSSQSVAEFEKAYFFPSDAKAFQQQYGLPTIAPVVHGPNHPNSGYLGEASLDVEYIGATGYGIPVTVISMPGSGFDMIGWAQEVAETPEPALVHSVSWGNVESNFNSSWITRVDTEVSSWGFVCVPKPLSLALVRCSTSWYPSDSLPGPLRT